MYPIEYVAICLSIHWLFAACLGGSVYLWMWTMYSEIGRPTIRNWASSVCFGVGLALFSHWVIDYAVGVA